MTFIGSEATGTTLLLHVPSNRYFRLMTGGARLLQLFDGTRSVEEATRCVQDELQVSISPQEVNDLVVSSFAKFLDLPSSFGVAEVELQRTVPNYLRLSMMMVSGGRVAKVTRYLQKLFRPRVAGPLLVTGLLLMVVAFFQYWGALTYYFTNAPLTDVGAFLAVMLSLSVVHELGHAAACKYYRVHHGGIGIGFYLLTPVMYADVTAAWELPARQRMVINVGGMYFELLYCVGLLLLLFITGNAIFLGFTLVVLAHTLYNLNPFFRTDGYWLLTDAIGQSNLRGTSNQLLMDTVRGLLIGSIPPAAARQRWSVAYAAVTYAMIGVFLYYVIFVFETSLFTFPTALEDLYYDVLLHRQITLPLLSEYLHQLLIPIVFYYMVVQLALRPTLRYVRRLWPSPTTTFG
jgi:putative peptide zinc metalloprotease protein